MSWKTQHGWTRPTAEASYQELGQIGSLQEKHSQDPLSDLGNFMRVVVVEAPPSNEYT